MGGIWSAILAVMGIGALAAAVAPAPAQALGKLDGPWAGRMQCGQNNSYRDSMENPFTGKVKFEGTLGFVVTGSRMISGKINPGVEVDLDLGEFEIDETGTLRFDGTYEIFRGNEREYHFKGRLVSGVLNLWFENSGGGSGCKAKLHQRTYGALKRAEAAKAAAGSNPDTARPVAQADARAEKARKSAAAPVPAQAAGALDGTWKGPMACGGKFSYEDSPDKPYDGKTTFSRESLMRIAGNKVTFLKAATPKGRPKLNLSRGDIGPGGRLRVEGSFVSKHSDKTFSYSFKGKVENGAIVLWGKLNEPDRGCRVVYRRVETGSTQVAAAASRNAELEAQRKVDRQKAAAANARAEAARKAADAERKKLAAEIAALRKAQEARKREQAALQPTMRSKTAGAGGSPLQRQLATLKNLLNQGLITEKQYKAKQQVLLNRFVGAGPSKTAASLSTGPGGPAGQVQIEKNLAKYQGIEFGKYFALVIGNNEYKYLPKLKTARNDARAVAESLRKSYGYEVTLLEDANHGTILDAFDVLREKLTDQDNLLIYYAGHGWLDEAGNEGYWMPTDAKPNRRRNWISNASITTTLKALNAKHVLVMADSCFSGALVRGIKVKDTTPDYVRRMAEKRARLVITSGGLEPVADSAGGGHSPFATAFLDVLNGNNGVLDGTDLFSRMRRPVMLKADQTPAYADVRKAGHEGGDYLFVRRK